MRGCLQAGGLCCPDGLPPFKLLDKDKKSSVDLRTYCFAVPYAICDRWNIRLQQQGLVVPALMRESRSMKAGVAKQHVTIDSCHQRCGSATSTAGDSPRMPSSSCERRIARRAVPCRWQVVRVGEECGGAIHTTHATLLEPRPPCIQRRRGGPQGYPPVSSCRAFGSNEGDPKDIVLPLMSLCHLWALRQDKNTIPLELLQTCCLAVTSIWMLGISLVQGSSVTSGLRWWRESHRTLKLIWVMPAERDEHVFRYTNFSLSDYRRFCRRHLGRHQRA